jgi:diaminopimelate decarboxylase
MPYQNTKDMMLHKNTTWKKLKSLIGLPSILDKQMLQAYIRPFLDDAEKFLSASGIHGSPLYVLDINAFDFRLKQFSDTFGRRFRDFKTYLAVKCNHHPILADAAVKHGAGLDVSSGDELNIALKSGCADILFSGPGKTTKELMLAVDHCDSVTILIDSFSELDRLASAMSSRKQAIRCGVRLCTEEKGVWRKFGIRLSRLEKFLAEAASYDEIDMAGIQFHTSWNRYPDRQIEFIRKLGEQLTQIRTQFLSSLRFLDIGGGYWPEKGEWVHFQATNPGRLMEFLGLPVDRFQAHYRFGAADIKTFAQKLSEAVEIHIAPILQQVSVKAEPGRWLCDDAMHLLLTVVDKKEDDLVITDAGMNTIGWERFETDYAPIINLSRPSIVERKCRVLGALCTPHDLWGYSYFGTGIEPGDILLIPTQGAYTYSLRQNFIKPLPDVVTVDR